MFTVSLCCLLGYHCFLVARNRTTLEVFKPAVFGCGPDRNGFDLGYHENVKEALGHDTPFLWLFPVGTPRGDGVTFKIRHCRRSYHHMELGE